MIYLHCRLFARLKLWWPDSTLSITEATFRTAWVTWKYQQRKPSITSTGDLFRQGVKSKITSWIMLVFWSPVVFSLKCWLMVWIFHPLGLMNYLWKVATTSLSWKCWWLKIQSKLFSQTKPQPNKSTDCSLIPNLNSSSWSLSKFDCM